MILRFAFIVSFLVIQPALAEPPMRIAVASNYATALKGMVSDYQAAQNDLAIISVSIGSTGKLYAQIKNGAPFDLFFSADADRPNDLFAGGFTVEPSQTYTTGRLVVWHPKLPAGQSVNSILNNVSRLAIANPNLAPYGLAAKQTLENLDWEISEKNQVITAENVGQVFAMVRTGNVPAGFVALTQMREQQIPIGQYTLIDEQAHQSINQGVVQLKNGLQPAQARAFLRYLISKTGPAPAADPTTPINSALIDR